MWDTSSHRSMHGCLLDMRVSSMYGMAMHVACMASCIHIFLQTPRYPLQYAFIICISYHMEYKVRTGECLARLQGTVSSSVRYPNSSCALCILRSGVHPQLLWRGTDSERRLLSSLGLSEIADQARLLEAAEEAAAGGGHRRVGGPRGGRISGANAGSGTGKGGSANGGSFSMAGGPWNGMLPGDELGNLSPGMGRAFTTVHLNMNI